MVREINARRRSGKGMTTACRDFTLRRPTLAQQPISSNPASGKMHHGPSFDAVRSGPAHVRNKHNPTRSGQRHRRNETACGKAAPYAQATSPQLRNSTHGEATSSHPQFHS